MKGYYSKPLPHEDRDDGDIFTLDEWQELLANQDIMPYDGTGYQATMLGYDQTLDAFDKKAEDCTHIVWFNK